MWETRPKVSKARLLLAIYRATVAVAYYIVCSRFGGLPMHTCIC